MSSFVKIYSCCHLIGGDWNLFVKRVGLSLLSDELQLNAFLASLCIYNIYVHKQSITSAAIVSELTNDCFIEYSLNRILDHSNSIHIIEYHSRYTLNYLLPIELNSDFAYILFIPHLMHEIHLIICQTILNPK